MALKHRNLQHTQRSTAQHSKYLQTRMPRNDEIKQSQQYGEQNIEIYKKELAKKNQKIKKDFLEGVLQRRQRYSKCSQSSHKVLSKSYTNKIALIPKLNYGPYKQQPKRSTPREWNNFNNILIFNKIKWAIGACGVFKSPGLDATFPFLLQNRGYLYLQ